MKNVFKRFVALALVLVLCVAMAVAVTVSATETDDSARATLSISATKSGNQIKVAVNVSGSANVSCLQVNVNFDKSKVKFASYDNGDLIDGEAFDKNADDGYILIMWEDKYGVADGSKDTLGTLTFDILDGASGDAAFSLSEGYVFNFDYVEGTTTYGTQSSTVSFYNITTASVTNGTIKVDKTTATKGETVTVTATPASDYEVGTVTYNGNAATSAGDNKYTFTMPAKDVEVSAQFVEKSYSVTVDKAISNGTVTVSPASAKKGETVTITVKPNAGYDVSTVTFNGTAATKKDATTYTFTMPAKDVTVSASFAAKTYNITKDSAVNGKFDVPSTAKTDQTVTITVQPNSGYEVDKVTVTGTGNVAVSGSGSSYSFKMPAADVKVSVTFKEATYKVTVGTVSNGTVKVDKTTAKKGEKIKITVTPGSEYLIKAVTAGSETVTKVDDTTYTFVMPAKNVTVSATFTAKTYQVNVSADANGTAKVDKTTAAKGETVTVTVSPKDGYVVDKITVSGVTVTKQSSTKFTFKMPSGDATVSVTFKEGSTAEPTEEPTVEPTEEPTVEPTEEPTVEPTVEPTEEPTAEPTGEPTAEPTNPVNPTPVQKEGNPIWIWILILVMIVCIVAIRIILYRNKKGNKENP